ncbi:hypothetical protein MMC32_000028 [Xylographa parallela]|nr:hypothetical protein [Xylographa parallela]
MPTLETWRGSYLWRYIPSLPAAVTFAVLFGIVTTAHTWKMSKTRTWFCLPFVIGGVFEEIGYISRAAANNATGALPPYLIQAIFLLLPPVLFAASLYMVFARVIRAVQGDSFSLISPRWTTRIFVLGDVTCLLIQSNGSGLLAKQKTVLTGDYIIVAGLGLQVLLFAGFMVCCLTFNIRFRGHMAKTGAASDIPWQSSLNMLYATSLAILVRNIYRMTEFVMGQYGYLLSNEWPAYVFDGALMLLVMIAFFIWYPNQLQPSVGDEVTELTSDSFISAEHGRAVKYGKSRV